ncbi:MAG: hypothetical protein H0Z19_02030 [Archaeoglobus sp.]|uniref:hypothetical protein n=1 Tax=Archaeoglobus sp. TaxID=1872626 RepID=UPI001DC63931|nr:hypothetical protein [Archaeoglobus sp.]MBO8179252.1 hypothetical protein [Archaeoglobus sp.]
MIGKIEAVVLYMISEGVGSIEELKAILPISEKEIDDIVATLEREGYLENANGLKLTKKGFEVLMQEEVANTVSEVRKSIEKLAPDGEFDEEAVEEAVGEIERLVSDEEIVGKVGEAKLFLQNLAMVEERNAEREKGELGKTEIVILYLISEGVNHSLDIKTLLPVSSKELDTVLEELQKEGYIENSDGLRLTKKGFDVLIENSKEVEEYVEEYLRRKVKKVNEVKRLIEKLSSGEVEVRSGIRYYLSPEEEILSQCRDSLTGYEFYATNARILKYKATTKGEDFAELPYSEVDGIALSTRRDVRLLVGGGAIIALGLVVGFWAFPLIGIGALGLYFYRTSVFYEFVGSGVENRKIARKWRILDTESREVQEFVRCVREEITKRKLKRNQYNST